jgi:mannose-6-phosphate isomerase-like protein (cupin superfamily)
MNRFFFVLQGQALIVIEGEEIAVAQGDLATVPRWAVHQTRNGSRDHELRLLAVTDFGLTSALLGNYDRQTRLKSSGKQAIE